MLARKRAAELDDRAKHLLARGLHLVEHVAVAHIEKDVGVQVAIAGVEHVGHRQLVVLPDLADRGKHLRQARARDDAVMQVVVGLDAA